MVKHLPSGCPGLLGEESRVVWCYMGLIVQHGGRICEGMGIPVEAARECTVLSSTNVCTYICLALKILDDKNVKSPPKYKLCGYISCAYKSSVWEKHFQWSKVTWSPSLPLGRKLKPHDSGYSLRSQRMIFSCQCMSTWQRVESSLIRSCILIIIIMSELAEDYSTLSSDTSKLKCSLITNCLGDYQCTLRTNEF